VVIRNAGYYDALVIVNMRMAKTWLDFAQTDVGSGCLSSLDSKSAASHLDQMLPAAVVAETNLAKD
jgi:hypothetical protein